MNSRSGRRPSPPWAELPADVLSEITRHLHEAADSVRFHAVCGSWHNTPPPSPAPRFLPWLIPPCDDFSSGSGGIRFRSPFAKTKDIHCRRQLRSPHGTRLLLHSSDPASGRVLAVDAAAQFNRRFGREASLVNPLTGDAISLPLLPPVLAVIRDWAKGVVASNGPVVFHSTLSVGPKTFVLRPGETCWRFVANVPCPAGGVASHDDEDILFLDRHTCRAAALCSSGVLPGGACPLPKLPPRQLVRGRHVLEAHGELLCVDVLDVNPCLRQAAGGPAASVSVHALEVGGAGAGSSPRWVERGRGGVGNNVCLFLGCEDSFAVDAREFAGAAEVTGGCAYFIGRHPKWTATKEVHAVYRYSFEDGTAAVVDELPASFNTKSMWYTPRPRISPVLTSHVLGAMGSETWNKE